MTKSARLIIDIALFIALFILSVMLVPAVKMTMSQSDRFAEFVWSLGIRTVEQGYYILMGLIYFVVALVAFLLIKFLIQKFRK